MTTTINMDLANRISAVLERQGLTEQALAKMIGISVERLDARMCGRTPFTAPDFFAISSALGIDPAQFSMEINDGVDGADQ